MNSNDSTEKRQVCSKAVYDLLMSFNALSSIEEQEEVLDVIYETMYHRSYKAVLTARVVLEAHVEQEEIEKENAMLRSRNELLEDKIVKYASAVETDGKKKLKMARRGLLAIINNIKHFLGDSWENVLPGGMAKVDEYLAEVDVEGILGRITWREYEAIASSDTSFDSVEPTEWRGSMIP